MRAYVAYLVTLFVGAALESCGRAVSILPGTQQIQDVIVGRSILLPNISLLNSLFTDHPTSVPYLTVTIEDILKYALSETGRLCS